MPGFRRWGKSKFERNPESSFKLLAAIIVITLYLLIKEFQNPTVRERDIPKFGAQLQHGDWNGTGKADEARAKSVRDAMKYTFWKYRENAWGCDDILPVSGGNSSSRNGWGAFIVDSASTLALMGLWDELAHSLEHILAIDFNEAKDLVDPFETTIRYLGGLLSIVDMYDTGLIPEDVLSEEARDLVLEHAVTLAGKLAPAYDTPTGMPWPRVDFETEQGEPDPSFVFSDDPTKHGYDQHPAIGPARTGSSILENRVLTRLTGNLTYTQNSTNAWAPLVWSKWKTPWPGMVDAPVDIMTGEPVGRQRHWDGGHDSYYEYLVKMTLLAPPTDPHLGTYKHRFTDAAYSLRKHLSSRSAPAPDHYMQHLYIGRYNKEYENQQGHLACFAPGTILLASRLYDEPYLRTFALALLEGCRHSYTSTPTKIGPETWAWIPKFGYDDPLFIPETARQEREAMASGIWALEPAYKGRPEYVESVFYAWRITGDKRYREWAWEAFSAMEKHCKAPFGYAQLADVYDTKSKGEDKWVDMQESFWAAETLKYLWLTFSDVEVASLDSWVFSTEGHPFRMMR